MVFGVSKRPGPAGYIRLRNDNVDAEVPDAHQGYDNTGAGLPIRKADVRPSNYEEALCSVQCCTVVKHVHLQNAAKAESCPLRENATGRF